MSGGAAVHCSPLGKMAKITDFLYLGGLAAAKMEGLLKEKGITCVINGKLIRILTFTCMGCPTIRFFLNHCLFDQHIDQHFHFLSLFKASTEAPDINYDSIKCTRIRLEDNATCNIGIHFDLVADKIGKLNYKLNNL